MKEFKLQDSKQRDIQCYKWDNVNNIKGIVQIIHGAREHAKRYDHLANYLNSKGYIVFSNDILGHGKTRNGENYVYFSEKDGYKDVVDFVIQLKKHIQIEYPNHKISIYGHSMGSFITRYVISKFPNEYQMAIISGSTLQPTLLVKSGKIIANLLKHIQGEKKVSNLLHQLTFGNNIDLTRKKYHIIEDYEWLTTDLELVKKIKNDKLMDPKFSNSAQVDLVNWLDYVSNKKHIKSMNKDMPIIFISGYEDPLSFEGKAIKSLVKMYEENGMNNVSCTIFDGMRHEVHNEINKEKVYQVMTTFLDKNSVIK